HACSLKPSGARGCGLQSIGDEIARRTGDAVVIGRLEGMQKDFIVVRCTEYGGPGKGSRE
ncbi:MAG: hypothetical protein GYA56_13680, partial [Geobacteraceae bacterium]|nr:hypothetical protein [Geobacteraceae bacterium]